MALAPLMTSKLPMPLSCFNACSWPNNALSDAQTVQIPLLLLYSGHLDSNVLRRQQKYPPSRHCATVMITLIMASQQGRDLFLHNLTMWLQPFMKLCIPLDQY